jgi:hypothetical protein
LACVSPGDESPPSEEAASVTDTDSAGDPVSRADSDCLLMKLSAKPITIRMIAINIAMKLVALKLAFILFNRQG